MFTMLYVVRKTWVYKWKNKSIEFKYDTKKEAGEKEEGYKHRMIERMDEDQMLHIP